MYLLLLCIIIIMYYYYYVLLLFVLLLFSIIRLIVMYYFVCGCICETKPPAHFGTSVWGGGGRGLTSVGGALSIISRSFCGVTLVK